MSACDLLTPVKPENEIRIRKAAAKWSFCRLLPTLSSISLTNGPGRNTERQREGERWWSESAERSLQAAVMFPAALINMQMCAGKTTVTSQSSEQTLMQRFTAVMWRSQLLFTLLWRSGGEWWRDYTLHSCGIGIIGKWVPHWENSLKCPLITTTLVKVCKNLSTQPAKSMSHCAETCRTKVNAFLLNHILQIHLTHTLLACNL